MPLVKPQAGSVGCLMLSNLKLRARKAFAASHSLYKNKFIRYTSDSDSEMPSLNSTSALEPSLALNVGTTTVLICSLVLALISLRIFYNLHLHPLARFPGPFWARSSLVRLFFKSCFTCTYPLYLMLTILNSYGVSITRCPAALTALFSLSTKSTAP